MKKTGKKLILFVVSVIVFTICIIYSINLKQSFIVYADGYVDNGNIKIMNITAYHGFNDEGRDKSLYKGNLGIPKSGKVELRVKANTNGNDKMSISFKDGEGNVIFEENSNKIFSSKIIDAKKGKWFFEINSQDVKAGDFMFIVIQK